MRFDRNLLVNLGLLALALSTALFLFLTRDRVTQDESAARPNNLIPVLRPEQLTRVVVQRGADSLVLEVRPEGNAGARYLLGSRAEVEADPEAARSFLRALELSSFVRKLELEGADRKVLGLSSPRARLRVEFRGLSGEVAIGKNAVTPSDSSYVEVSGFGGKKRLGLVRTSALDELLVTEDDLRPRWLVSYAPSELAQLIFRDGEAPAVTLQRSGPSFRRAGGKRVAREVTDRLLLELSRARIERVATGLDASFPAESRFRAEFHPTEQRAPVQLELGGACPGDPQLVAFRRTSPQPMSACVVPTVRDLFADSMVQGIDPAVFALHADEVESVAIERGGERLALRRSAKGFELEGPTHSEIELGAGNRVLEALLGVRGKPMDPPHLAKLGLLPPAGTVRLVSSTIEGIARYEEVVEMGRPRPDGELALRRLSDGAVLLVPRDTARAFTPDSTDLRGRRLLDFGPSELKTLELEWPGVHERLARTDGGVFELLEPRGFEHDAELVLGLVQQLGTLEADRWVSPKDDGTFGLATPSLQVRAQLNPAERAAVRLTIGRETSGGYFGALDGTPGVFVVPKAFVHDATTLLLSRSVFVLELSAFDAIELELGARRLRLERQGDGFSPHGGSPELAPALVERLLANLSTLRAEAALHTGPARKAEGLEHPVLRIRLTAAKNQGQNLVFTFGAETSLRGTSVRFARRSDVDATYGVPASSLRGILEAL